MLINLLKNALEAMPQGGEITITTRVKGANVEISLADTGEGMSPEVAGNIFQPYFTTKEKGTGLGLAICQGIIQEHGGVLSVASTPGRGTTFTIQLPLNEAPGRRANVGGHRRFPRRHCKTAYRRYFESTGRSLRCVSNRPPLIKGAGGI